MVRECYNEWKKEVHKSNLDTDTECLKNNHYSTVLLKHIHKKETNCTAVEVGRRIRKDSATTAEMSTIVLLEPTN